jgi:hypothetical protein
MQQVDRRETLCLRLGDPFAGSGSVHLGSLAAGSGCDAVQDRPVERGIDDLVVGHVCPLFNTPNLKAGPLNGYGAKSRIVQ